jgi:predicted CoA-binding protein
MPESVAEFLAGERLAVAGVSRDSRQAANAVFRKLRSSGHDVVPINPRASEVEGVRCYPDVGSVPKPLHGLVIATHPSVGRDLVAQCATHGIRRVWFHRSFGAGSVSPEAVRECEARGVACIVGGCPLMYCEPVDPAHRCMRWLLRWGGRAPG